MNKPVANLNTALSSPRPVAATQAAGIEHSRAIAEVQSMVVVAQNCPRNEAQAIQKMREACGRLALAEMAFFKFPRGGSTVQGPSVHLARELARCWGNINYGVSELDRDDLGGKSEMVAYAWDVQTNARSATAFIVPHKRDKKGGAETLVDMRDIYENNANNAARRLREMVFSVLPKWYVEEAKQLCRLTLEKGEGDKPLTQRIADAISALEKLGVSVERIEAKIGAKSAAWTPVDIANLAVSFRSIKNKEVSADDEFPPLGAAKLDDALRTVAGPVVGTVDVDADAEKIIDDGDKAEREAAVAERKRLIDALNEMPDEENLDAWAEETSAQVGNLPADLAATIKTAVEARRAAIKKKVRK
jgi:hypothetical protein